MLPELITICITIFGLGLITGSTIAVVEMIRGNTEIKIKEVSTEYADKWDKRRDRSN